MTNANSQSGAPTVLLVHGAFADASGWAGVIERLQAAGITTRAVVNPLRGIAADAAYIAGIMEQIPGPVLAVGHSYGGAVITNAASRVENVVGLVYVAAFAPDENETLLDIESRSRDSALSKALRETTYPTGHGMETAGELSIDPAAFPAVFAADLPEAQAAAMAVSQRPVASASFGEKSGPPAWKTLPSWSVVATGDKAAGADVVRSMAQRAGADILEIDGSHVIMISQPAAVAAVIMKAIQSIG